MPLGILRRCICRILHPPTVLLLLRLRLRGLILPMGQLAAVVHRAGRFMWRALSEARSRALSFVIGGNAAIRGGPKMCSTVARFCWCCVARVARGQAGRV